MKVTERTLSNISQPVFENSTSVFDGDDDDLEDDTDYTDAVNYEDNDVHVDEVDDTPNDTPDNHYVEETPYYETPQIMYDE